MSELTCFSAVFYPDVFSHCWIHMGTQILSPKFLEQGLLEDIRLDWEVHLKPIYKNSKNLSGRDPSGSGGPAVLFKQTIDACTGMLRTVWLHTILIWILSDF